MIYSKGFRDTLIQGGLQFAHLKDSSVFLDATKVDLGRLNVFDFPNGVGTGTRINTMGKGTPLHTYGPWGKNYMSLLSADGRVKLSNDQFDYEQHDFGKAWKEGAGTWTYELIVRHPSILVPLLVLSLVLCWFLAFRKTFDAISLNRKLKRESDTDQNISFNPGFMKQNLIALDQILKGYQVGAQWNDRLWLQASVLSTKQGVAIDFILDKQLLIPIVLSWDNPNPYIFMETLFNWLN